ncbi:MAG: tRNA-dependent cyclodipeptide synthase [Sedimentisphaerales bacterium]|nr:tRNA-dependent cyclodipeptide synthase [Sedimentisphaerales bacterium]
MRSDSDFEKLNMPSVSIVTTTPKISNEKLFSYKKCYIGISLDNPGFYGKSLQALLLWGLGNFERVLVVAGDYLRRYNEQIFSGLSPDEAGKASHEFGDLFFEKTDKFFSQIPSERLGLTRWQPCLNSNEYKGAKEILDGLFDSDESFRAAVLKDAVSFIERQKKRNLKLAVSQEEAVELSRRYLLEEIAVFSALSEQGWKVELYPGPELCVLTEMSKNNYPNIPGGLKERINVELKIHQSKAKRS